MSYNMHAFNSNNIDFFTKDYTETLIDCEFMFASKCENKITLIVQRPQCNLSTHKTYYEIINDLKPPLKIRPYFIRMFDTTYKILDFEIASNLFTTFDEFSILRVEINAKKETGY